MPFVEDIKTISGNLIIDGTLESKHIKTDSIEANKFKGATEESYFNYFDGQVLNFNTYVTLHEFEIPSTELDLVKARHISVDWYGLLSTGQTATVGSTIYLYIEVQVPEDTPSFRLIGQANHVSYPVTGYQRVYLEGNYLNRFGIGQVGAISSYRTYRNLHYVEDERQSELVVNGTFSGSISNNWTAVNGTLINQFGTLALIQQDATPDRAYFYQAVTVEAGERYEFEGTNSSYSTAGGRLLVSTSSDIEDAFYTSDSYSSSSSFTDKAIITIPDGVTTVYVMGEVASDIDGDQHSFDNFSLKKLMSKTYVDISTGGGAVVSETNPTSIYHHPFGSASSNTWAVVTTRIMSFRSNPYNSYFNMRADAYLGIDRQNLKCRVRARHFFSGDYITTQDGIINLNARMTGEQHET